MKRSITCGRNRQSGSGSRPTAIPKSASREVANRSDLARTGLTGAHASTVVFAKRVASTDAFFGHQVLMASEVESTTYIYCVL
jgi:hypothetical protein